MGSPGLGSFVGAQTEGVTKGSTLGVLITTYNAEKTISRALESIAWQSRPPDSVVVIDDGSSDSSVAKAKEYIDGMPLEIIQIGRRGRAVALNAGVDALRTDYIAILDADDVSIRTRFEKQVAALDSRPRLGMIGSSFIQVTLEPKLVARRRMFPHSDSDIRRGLCYAGPFCHSSVVYRRSSLVEAGGFDPRCVSRIDQDLWVRIGAIGFEFENLPDPQVLHFKGDTYFSRKNRPIQRWGSMLRRNLSASRHLGVPRAYSFVAVIRSFASIAPKKLMYRFAPGLSTAEEISDVSKYELEALHLFSKGGG